MWDVGAVRRLAAVYPKRRLPAARSKEYHRLLTGQRRFVEGYAVFDVVIANGTLVDGTGATAYRADVGVAGDTITAIGDLSESDAGRVIDASGLVVAPGFVDTHTHSEGALLVDPQHANGLRQGITTELLGIDGMSYAPLSPGNYLMYRRWLGGLLGEPPVDLDMSTVAAFRQHYDRRVAVNTAYLVPHGTDKAGDRRLSGRRSRRTAHGPRETARPAGHGARRVGAFGRVELLPGSRGAQQRSSWSCA